MVGAKGFAAKVWMFESMDMSGMDTLSRVELDEFAGGEWVNKVGRLGRFVKVESEVVSRELLPNREVLGR